MPLLRLFLFLVLACSPVCADAVHNALGPLTQLGRALREAGVYKMRPQIEAELRSSGVSAQALGGYRKKPAANVLESVLEFANVPADKALDIVKRFGGPSLRRPIVLVSGAARIDLNEPFRLEKRLQSAELPPETRNAILMERSRGEFKDVADFETRMSKHPALQGEAAKPLGQVVEGTSAEFGKSAPKKTSRLREYLASHTSRNSPVPKAAQKFLVGPMQGLMTIMVFQAALQYRQNGHVDVQKAVAETLDSPQVWAGLVAAGATAHGVEALRASLAKSAGARAMFAKMLGGLPASIAALAAWEVATGYVDAATKGVKVPGKEAGDPVSISDMFRHREVGGAVLGNLAKIAINPVVQAQILGKVLRDRILTAEFFFTAAGMWAGGKVGTFAGVKIGAWAGAAFGPVGIGIGAVAGGIVGGITGGLVGGFGGALVGSSIDTWMARRSYTKAKEALVEADGDPAKRAKLGKDGMIQAVGAFDDARRKLVEKLSTDFAGKAKKLLQEKDLPKYAPGKEPSPDELEKRDKAIQSRQRQVEASRMAILDIYQEELDLLGKLIDSARQRGEDDSQLVEIENKAVTEMAMFMLGSQQVAGELPASAFGESVGELERPGASPEELPSYRQLPQASY